MTDFIIEQIFEGTYPPEAAMWCNENNAYIEEIEHTEDGKRQFKIVAIPQPSLQEQIEQAYAYLDSCVENRLDSFAQERKYANIVSACSYASSTNTKYAAEAAYCIKMRDETYDRCYELLNEYLPLIQEGKREIPTWEEIEPLLPVLSWDNM